jgi:hypothetical protein
MADRNRGDRGSLRESPCRESQSTQAVSSYHHRTSGGISDELTDAQKLEISQRLLAREVTNACVAWLDARGIVSKGPRRHYPTRAAGDPVEGQERGTCDDGQAKLSEKTENRGV